MKTVLKSLFLLKTIPKRILSTGVLLLEKVLDPIYKNLCPVCRGDAFAKELYEFGVCGKCSLYNGGVLNAVSLYNELLNDLKDFEEFFSKATNGLKPWGAQITWVKRLLNGENTVIVAPTGMGKTTLLIVYALYSARYFGKKTLFLAPTRALAKQIYQRLLSAVNSIGAELRIVFYDSGLSKKRKEEVLEKIRNNDFDVLVLTNHFMNRRYDVLSELDIDLIIIDDVDSLLKSSKNILRLMKLLGFSEELIEKAKRRNTLIWKLMLARSLNKEDDYKKYIEELIEIENEIEEMLGSHSKKQVVIASATGRMRGAYAKVMRDLLRIDVSGISIYGRNITDSYLLINSGENSYLESLINVIDQLGPGGLILLSPRHPLKNNLKKILENTINKLVEKKYRVAEAKPSTIKKFVDGEYDLLVGSSSYYGVSVRGIDAPETIKYVIFIGTPVFTIDLDSFLASPNMIIRVLLLLAETAGDNSYRVKANNVRKLVFTLNSSELRMLSMLLKGKLTVNDISNSKIEKIYNELLTYYHEVLEDTKKYLDKLGVINMNTITLYKNKDRYVAIIPDVMTYIQASGRCSRLYLGKMTHGLSIIVEDKVLENLVTGLNKKMNMFNKDLIFAPLEKIDLSLERKLINESRKRKDKGFINYRNVLIVVESPTKAKTIARFFGKPVRRKIGSTSVYEIPFVKENEVIHLNIVATRGHLFDLTTDPTAGYHGIIINEYKVSPVYTTIKRCRVCGHQFTYGEKCPRCGSGSFIDSYEVVNVLRKLAQEADEVYIATDPDIEGEKIAYDVYLVIKSFVDKIWRIELHEITVSEFMKALSNKRSINLKLVEAEIYRRVMDRLIGFSLSQELWRIYGKKWYGAGRVQTPVLGWIINSYNEYLANKCRKIIIKTKQIPLKISVCIDHKDKDLYEKLKSLKTIVLKKKKLFVEEVKPAPPYTTDELLFDASRIGIPSALTMKIAQELFESGLITYHRTDSHYVSSTGIGIASKYVEEKGLSKLFKPNHWGSKGAHEAIRPVHPLDREDLEKAIVEGLISPVIPLTWLHFKVYDLIFRRFMASQMKPYKVLRGEFLVRLTGDLELSIVLDIDIVEEGFNVVKPVKTYPELRSIDEVVLEVSEIKSIITSKKPLYNEGSIIKKMKQEGLGRPSTYSKIISSIVRHGYVIRSKKKGYLIPTKSGIQVYDYLIKNYPVLVSVETTKKMEEVIDLIAYGRVGAVDKINEFYELIKNYKLPLSIKDVEAYISI